MEKFFKLDADNRIELNQWFIPKPMYATYPPYHQGLYLEDYFINWLYNQPIKTSATFIPISWTSYYNNGMCGQILQDALDLLPKDISYYVVCQHADAPAQRLPPNTTVFSSGGNYSQSNCIPIPLICSLIPKPDLLSKDIFCSFVGSSTHLIRKEIYDTFNDDSEFYFYLSKWSQKVSQYQLDIFIHITNRSKFSLCPRGYGKTSFRLYEAMQLESVPVYVSDYHYLPWTDELNWNEFCVLIGSKDVRNIKHILKDIDDVTYEKMLMKSKEIYGKYFSLDAVCSNIIKQLCMKM